MCIHSTQKKIVILSLTLVRLWHVPHVQAELQQKTKQLAALVRQSLRQAQVTMHNCNVPKTMATLVEILGSDKVYISYLYVFATFCVCCLSLALTLSPPFRVFKVVFMEWMYMSIEAFISFQTGDAPFFRQFFNLGQFIYHRLATVSLAHVYIPMHVRLCVNVHPCIDIPVFFC